MGWLRITFPPSTPIPTWAAELNAEADRLDIASEPAIEGDYVLVATNRRYEQAE